MMEVECNWIEKVRRNDGEEEDDGVPLPGFRFHPTDEELVGFYLRRRVEKKPIVLQIIKHVDIYRYDPWDLPKSNGAGDQNESYFFCKRGRKYRNSIRPNRVTGSGFWKATGIDRPVYSSGAGAEHCIGLKKSLVFYRGSAGKGTKTDWMMHEFRLPPTSSSSSSSSSSSVNRRTIKFSDDEVQEAEVWTLCRILKRKVSYKKSCNPNRKEMEDSSPKSGIKDCSWPKNYISFSATNDDKEPYFYEDSLLNNNFSNQPFSGHFSSQISHPQSTDASSSFASSSIDMDKLLRFGDWEDLQAIVDHSYSAIYDSPNL